MFSHRCLLVSALGLLVACTNAGGAAVSSSDLTVPTSALEASVTRVGDLIAARSEDNDYLVTDRFTSAELDVGPVVTGPERRAALLACAVYGGGRSVNPSEDEDLDKYLPSALREEVAAALDAAIGDAKVHRIDAFGIGDIGDDFTAHCTVAVEEDEGFLALQGHGHDSFF